MRLPKITPADAIRLMALRTHGEHYRTILRTRGRLEEIARIGDTQNEFVLSFAIVNICTCLQVALKHLHADAVQAFGKDAQIIANLCQNMSFKPEHVVGVSTRAFT